MKKRLRDVLLVTVIVIAAAALLWQTLRQRQQQGTATTPAVSPAAQETPVVTRDLPKVLAGGPLKSAEEAAEKTTEHAAKGTLPELQVATVTYQASTLRDPFVNLLEEEQVTAAVSDVILPPLAVQGLVWGDDQRAIINDQVYRQGDVIEGAEILEISREGVSLWYQGRLFRLQPSGLDGRTPQPVLLSGERRPTNGLEKERGP